MSARSICVLALLSGAAMLMASCRSVPAESSTAPAVSIDEIAAGIEEHIAHRSEADGGYFRVEHEDELLNLELVRVHLEYLSHLGDGISFACVDLVNMDGVVYDVDFFMKGSSGNLSVTETSVHKRNGQPFYAWKQKRNGGWRKVAVESAPRDLLGVINGSDDFEFVYRAILPEIDGEARLWLPLAASDDFQRVEIKSIEAPGEWRELDEPEHGNKVLFLIAGPADSGKIVEIRYQVRRFEKSEYAERGAEPQRYLEPENLVPSNETFREIAQRVTEGKTTDMTRARALYDHVIEELRYARYGSGWGVGDAVYACDAQSGNCSDFHAYFIALAREAKIPARFAIGASIPSERNDGGIDGYHCWAEFFADGKWIPVDVSEADKTEQLADYYFGNNPANRFELSRGRDLVVQPSPASGPMNFLAYPVMEVDGKTVNVPTEFLFRRPG